MATLYTYRANVTRVIDGDTIVCDIDLGFYTWIKNMRLRLADINAPELRGIERPAGLNSLAALKARIEGKLVSIVTEKDSQDVYGRYLATIYLGNENINRWLLSEGLAEVYPKN